MFDVTGETTLTQEFQYGFRGLVFGAATDYITEKVEGLLGAPSVRAMDTDRLDGHGSIAGRVLMSKRTISFDIAIAGSKNTTTNEALVSEARRAFQVPRSRNFRVLEPLTFWRPGLPVMVAMVRCIRRDITSDFALARGAGKVAVELQSPDSLLYALTASSQTEQLAAAQSSKTFDVDQDGDFVDGASPTITITGPCTDPVITNNTDDGRAMRLDVVLNGGDDLVIDVERRIVYVNDVKTYSVVRSDNEWWNLLPGTNSISYNRDSGNAGGISEITFEWRSTFQ